MELLHENNFAPKNNQFHSTDLNDEIDDTEEEDLTDESNEPFYTSNEDRSFEGKENGDIVYYNIIKEEEFSPFNVKSEIDDAYVVVDEYKEQNSFESYYDQEDSSSDARETSIYGDKSECYLHTENEQICKDYEEHKCYDEQDSNSQDDSGSDSCCDAFEPLTDTYGNAFFDNFNTKLDCYDSSKNTDASFKEKMPPNYFATKIRDFSPIKANEINTGLQVIKRKQTYNNFENFQDDEGKILFNKQKFEFQIHQSGIARCKTLYQQNSKSFKNLENEMPKKRRLYSILKSNQPNFKKDSAADLNNSCVINSELCDGNYMQYVNSTHSLTIDNKNILLSPELETKTFDFIEKKANNSEVDLNSNEIKSIKNKSHDTSQENQDDDTHNFYTEICSRMKYAEDIKFLNIFKFSNEKMMEELLLDNSYKETELDFDFRTNTRKPSIFQMKIKNENPRNKNSETYITKQEGVQTKHGDKYASLEKSKHNFSAINEKSNVVNKLKNSILFKQLNRKSSIKNLESSTAFGKPKIESKISGTPSNIEVNPISDQPVKFYSDLERTFNLKNQNAPFGSLKLKFVKKKDESLETFADRMSYQIVGNKLWDCKICGMNFTTKKNLQQHRMNKHPGPYNSQCVDCKRKFNKSSAHKMHEEWCPQNKIYRCKYCDKTYRYKRPLEKHLESHKRK